MTLMMQKKILNSKKKCFQLSHSSLVKILPQRRIIITIIIKTSLLIMELTINIVLNKSNHS